MPQFFHIIAQGILMRQAQMVRANYDGNDFICILISIDKKLLKLPLFGINFRKMARIKGINTEDYSLFSKNFLSFSKICYMLCNLFHVLLSTYGHAEEALAFHISSAGKIADNKAFIPTVLYIIFSNLTRTINI